MTWLRRVLTWRPGWPEPGHWCGSCNIGRELDRYGRKPAPARETCPLTLDEEDQFQAIIAVDGEAR